VRLPSAVRYEHPHCSPLQRGIIYANGTNEGSRAGTESSRSYSVTFDNSMTDEPLFQSPQKLSETTDVPPRDGLYSTPLSWKRPQPGCRVGNPNSYAPPSPEEESKLRCIVMPAQPYLASPVSSPLPEPQDKHNRRKRKLTDFPGSCTTQANARFSRFPPLLFNPPWLYPTTLEWN
jgi:hypothetical protein